MSEYIEKLKIGSTECLFMNDERVQGIVDDNLWVERPADFNGYDYVDMGEAGIWATCNIGTSKPEGYGLYFSWGETKGYQYGGKSFSWEEGYKFGTRDNITKYNSTDGLTNLEPGDDAARVNMGGDWRMPTANDFAVLYNLCNKEQISNYKDTGIKGMLFKLKTDQTKQLFFPATGGINASSSGGSMSGVGVFINYWSSTLSTDNKTLGCYLSLYATGNNSTFVNEIARASGMPIRGFIPSKTIKEQKYLIQNYKVTTWQTLKNLRDNSQLTPGCWYRITDYQCTTTQKDTQSAGHQFDILVMATDVNRLSEEGCKAIHHKGDTYFANNKLEAWQIWYCLDNDTDRFAWADDTNGKGVIYRMIDEFNNDVPYDFKNIQFKRCKVTSANHTNLNIGYYGIPSTYIKDLINDESDYLWCYTFSKRRVNITAIMWDIEGDASLENKAIYSSSFGGYVYTPAGCTHNTIERYYNHKSGTTNTSVLVLNNIVFFTSSTLTGPSSVIGTKCNNNTFKEDCYNMTFIGAVYFNHFGNNCYNNIFNTNCNSNTFGNNCYDNIFDTNCSRNTFGNYCYSNTFGDYCDSNTFGNYCTSNTFGDRCGYNIFGNFCDSNTFGYYFQYNSVGNSVRNISVVAGDVLYTHILNGTSGTSGINKMIINLTSNSKSSQYAGIKSTGELKVWTPAENINITDPRLNELQTWKKRIYPVQYSTETPVTLGLLSVKPGDEIDISFRAGEGSPHQGTLNVSLIGVVDGDPEYWDYKEISTSATLKDDSMNGSEDSCTLQVTNFSKDVKLKITYNSIYYVHDWYFTISKKGSKKKELIVDFIDYITNSNNDNE